MEEVLEKLLKLSNKAKSIGAAPISAVLYDPITFEIIYFDYNKKSKNNKKSINMTNDFHAEHFIFEKIIKDKLDVSGLNLLITCPPCSLCINEMIKKGITFNKVEWLTSLGKDEELNNLRQEKYFGFLKNSGIIKLEGNLEKMRLMSCYKWISFKYYKNREELKIK